MVSVMGLELARKGEDREGTETVRLSSTIVAGPAGGHGASEFAAWWRELKGWGWWEACRGPDPGRHRPGQWMDRARTGGRASTGEGVGEGVPGRPSPLQSLFSSCSSLVPN